MADRRPFHEKYADLPQRWGISDEIVNYIIRRYSKKLEMELRKLKTEKIGLSRFFRDKRTDEEYVYDLIDGWLIEDIICDGWLRNRLLQIDNQITILHMGTNRDRTLQKQHPKKITTAPDFIYRTSSGKEVSIELQMARENRDSSGYDMKESKIKRALRTKAIFLWIILQDDEFFFVDPSEDLKDVRPISNPLWGGKLVYRLSPEKQRVIGRYPMKGPIPSRYHGLLGLTE